jgi:hypothetical protein
MKRRGDAQADRRQLQRSMTLIRAAGSCSARALEDDHLYRRPTPSRALRAGWTHEDNIFLGLLNDVLFPLSSAATS